MPINWWINKRAVCDTKIGFNNKLWIQTTKMNVKGIIASERLQKSKITLWFNLYDFFCSILLHLSPHTPRAVCLLSIYEPISVLLVSSVCSLDSAHEWNPLVLVFLCLAYFIWDWALNEIWTHNKYFQVVFKW